MGEAGPSIESTANVDALVRRVELSRIARQLQQRLSLAAYKVDHGVSTVPLAELEQQIGGSKPVASTSQSPPPTIVLPHDLGPPLPPSTPPKRTRTPSLADEVLSQPRARPRMPSEPGNRLYPAQMSLYDTLLSPSLDSLPGGTFSPVLEAGADGSARPVKRQRGTTAPGVTLASKALAASPARGSAAVARRALANRPSAIITNMGPPPVPSGKHRRSGSMPNASTRPLSTSDPSFARDVPDLLDAAAALTSFSRPPSSPSTPARASTSPTVSHRPGSAPPIASPVARKHDSTTPPADHPEDLLLYLASSPSPVVASRRICGEDREKSAGSESSLTPNSPLSGKRAASGDEVMKLSPLPSPVPRTLGPSLLPSAPINSSVQSPSISA